MLESGTGWPVLGGLRVLTAASDDCTGASVLSTFVPLHRREAEPFSREFGAACRVIR